jgi:uncharacterized protein YjiS (DUF1127 family)
MSTINDIIWLERTFRSTRYVSRVFWICWDAYQERRHRHRIQTSLLDLSDRELQDIGISRGEVDYVASNRGIDPRGIRSGTIV